MEDKSKSILRRYHLIHPHSEETLNHSHLHQQLIPITIDPSTRSENLSNKRRRSSITIESSSIHQQFSSNRSTQFSTRKRSAQDEIVEQFHRNEQQNTNKRVRYEYSRSIELENQPPRSSSRHYSSFLPPSSNSTWTNLSLQSDIPLFFPDSFSQTSTIASTRSFHQTIPDHHYSSSLLTDHHSSPIFSNHLSRISGKDNENFSFSPINSKLSKNETRFLSPQTNGNATPLRSTNFLLDTKDQSNLRNGNISPAHSDSSSESTSTCSSDEQFHQHLFPPTQPWRTYRERENYEQLLDLAEKLSDPNRFKQVDVQQFFSYRYKTSESNSKQTACVICMSHFKNGQNIRVLPCQHEYHSKCIGRWFKMNSSCPICRRDNFLSSC